MWRGGPLTAPQAYSWNHRAPSSSSPLSISLPILNCRFVDFLDSHAECEGRSSSKPSTHCELSFFMQISLRAIVRFAWIRNAPIRYCSGETKPVTIHMHALMMRHGIGIVRLRSWFRQHREMFANSTSTSINETTSQTLPVKWIFLPLKVSTSLIKFMYSIRRKVFLAQMNVRRCLWRQCGVLAAE